MMTDKDSEAKITKLLADGYSQRILSYTYRKPMSAQKLSALCHIPIAACYRRIHELERAGMLIVADEKEIYKGRKVKLYRCSLRHAVLRFSDGKFKVNYDIILDMNGDNGNAIQSNLQSQAEHREHTLAEDGDNGSEDCDEPSI